MNTHTRHCGFFLALSYIFQHSFAGCLVYIFVNLFQYFLFWLENILGQHGIYFKIKEDKFFKMLGCEAWIHNSLYEIVTSEIAVMSQEQNVTVMIAISVKY